jgi:MFS family permease
MDTQNTPVHLRLWNKDFWFLALANTLFSMTVYMQLVIVYQTLVSAGTTSYQTGLAVGIFALGLPLLGAFCSILVQRYRRNRVCIWAMLLMAACALLPVAFSTYHQEAMTQMMMGVRVATGALFGLAQMVLTSTLVIDTCEARQRTEANYAAAWFGRFAMSLGPLVAILLIRTRGMVATTWVSAALTLVAIIFVLMVRFPFRTPEDNVRLFSLDRFFLPGAWALFVNLLVVTVALGLLLTVQLDNPLFFAVLMMGFLLALIAEKYVFVNAEMKIEIVSGLILLIFSILLLMNGMQTTSIFIVPMLVGLGMGLIGSRFLLIFIKLSHHSKRGTSQSSFFLAFEMGIAAGIGWGISMNGPIISGRLTASNMQVLSIALILTVMALLVYVAFTHSWYLRHKSR